MSVDYSATFQANERKRTPRTVFEVEALLAAVYERRSSWSGWFQNPATSAIEPNMTAETQLPPLYLMPKHGKGGQLRTQLDQIYVASSGGYPPGPTDASRVFDLLDVTGSVR